MPLRIKTMRTILIAFLMTLATQVGAQQLTVAVSALLSDAQVKLENQNFAGQIDGVSVTTEYMLSPDWHLAYEHLSGSGNFNGTTSDFSFNQHLVYAYREFSQDSTFFLNWKLGYKIGAGFYQKTSKFGTETYSETQLPLVLGAEITNTSGVRISFSGVGQLNNLNNKRSGSLSLSIPVMSNSSVIGRYTNHISKVNGLQHCGSDYFMGFSVQF